MKEEFSPSVIHLSIHIFLYFKIYIIYFYIFLIRRWNIQTGDSSVLWADPRYEITSLASGYVGNQSILVFSATDFTIRIISIESGDSICLTSELLDIPLQIQVIYM